MKNYLIVRVAVNHAVGSPRFTIEDVSCTPKVDFRAVVKSMSDEACVVNLDRPELVEFASDRPCLLAEGDNDLKSSRLCISLPLPEEREHTGQVLAAIVGSSRKFDHEYGPDIGLFLGEQAQGIVEPSVEVHGTTIGYWEDQDSALRLDVNLSNIHTAEVLYV